MNSTVALHELFVVRLGLILHKQAAIRHYSAKQSCLQAALDHLVVTRLTWNMHVTNVKRHTPKRHDDVFFPK